LLPQELRHQLSGDIQDFDQWLSSYRQIFLSNTQTLQEECATFKRENDQLHKNMNEVENQLKEIERTVQSKEELLLIDLKSKDATVESLRAENDQSNAEMQRLHAEIDRLQMAHDAAATEARALKLQLDERFLVAVNSPSVVADESFELIKQPTPSSSPIGVDIRAEQLNELIRSGKEALENQDSLVQELGRHLNDMHRGSSGTGETSTDNVNESTVPSSSDQQQSAS
jgi:DNA repair exonuclease SbcCD ATPase subunit